MTAPFLVGHRTTSATAVAAYVAAGVTYLELDVRLVRGRAVVTHHQPVPGSFGALERDHARVRRSSRGVADPTVAELTGGLPPGSRVLFDPKDRDAGPRLAEVLATAVDDPGFHVVSMRDLRSLKAFAAQGFRTWWTLDTPGQVRRAAAQVLPTDGVTVRHHALTAEAVGALHGVTDTVVAWTLRSVARANEVVAYGVDGVTTHDLEVMTAVGRRRPERGGQAPTML